MATPILLLLGAGSNIGHHVARSFAEKGYKIALVSRSLKEEDSTQDQFSISADLSNPTSITEVFSKVRTRLGHPSVVVYNAAAATPSDPKDPLSLSLTEFINDTNINTTSAFAAAKEAVLSFAELPEAASKTFIYTGNILNTTVMPPLLDLGVGKAATAHIIQLAAEAYADRGYKFYYADERKADGSSAGRLISGEAHGALYVSLSEDSSQGPWQQTFVEGVGYKQF
ncbi:hypothetical protein PENANT_c040G04409 [Penicillium antarcticum]|uniref:Short-chain dehydrogenase n=1 Tax=Penicillium antarcticum TaxID=416450 RepID=A0A1V6PTK5_9EURO|nr:uncharacterized protein N7508_000230 [Penicillium antarcticum]KAJ5319947.1 hypothetical protein N7508_000230 [Penicillium antarcticum]OQD80047.1 hypothetical protein PENANT_c040G04409 [Penicillium antarcticum]